MAIVVVDGGGSPRYLKATGTGVDAANAYVPHHNVDAIVGALPAGTNNVGDADILSLVGDSPDLDSGAGTDPHAGVAVLLPASGGHVVGGTGAVGVLAAAGASIRDYLTHISVINAAVSAGTPVNIGDGTATLFTGYAAEKGGGFVAVLPVPLRPAQNATIWVAATVASALLHVNISGFKGW